MAVGILHVSAEIVAQSVSNEQCNSSITRQNMGENPAFGFSPEINLIDTVAK